MSHAYKSLLLLLISCLACARLTRTSGVFELKLMRFEPTTSLAPQTSVRLSVCLKEAFTSQLDGPCTYGNSSLALNQFISAHSTAPNTTTTTTSREENNNTTTQQVEQQQQQQQRGSQMTNLVRITFNYRWTKSFTIILTVDQINSGGGGGDTNQQQQQQISARLNQTAATSAANSSQAVAATLDGNQLQKQQLNSMAGDRHVLTENEVLPALTSTGKQHWIERPSNSAKSMLVYRFRVFCSRHYYGDGCSIFCRPRDDNFGHYSCSLTGQKLCLDGWQGADCDRPKCRVGCNQMHGFCDKPNECQCRPGWTGARCDECIPYPGCAHGFCLAPWQCVCQPNWGGVLCDQDLNYCATLNEPCANNATCQNVAPGRYKCQCLAGFTGAHCEHKIVELPPLPPPPQPPPITQLFPTLECGTLNPCLNGGTCFGFSGDYNTIGATGVNASYRCQCLPGYTGDFCQTVTLASSSAEATALDFDQQLYTTSHTNLTSTTQEDLRPPAEVETPHPLQMIELETMPTTARLAPTHMEMRQLISGVVVASAIGVFCAALLLAWCCLVAIEKGRFHFIQMNVITHSESPTTPDLETRRVSSTLRRVHEKIRDSFRRKRAVIKPETKLSLENVLKGSGGAQAPPSYEESNTAAVCMQEHQQQQQQEQHYGTTKATNQMRGAIEQEMALKRAAANAPKPVMQCPKHGHLYNNYLATTIEIEHKPPHRPPAQIDHT